jgi:hypothetical protein
VHEQRGRVRPPALIPARGVAFACGALVACGSAGGGGSDGGLPDGSVQAGPPDAAAPDRAVAAPPCLSSAGCTPATPVCCATFHGFTASGVCVTSDGCHAPGGGAGAEPCSQLLGGIVIPNPGSCGASSCVAYTCGSAQPFYACGNPDPELCVAPSGNGCLSQADCSGSPCCSASLEGQGECSAGGCEDDAGEVGYVRCGAASDCPDQTLCCVAAETSYGVCITAEVCSAQPGAHYELCAPGAPACAAGVSCEKRACPVAPELTSTVNACAEGTTCTAP